MMAARSSHSAHCSCGQLTTSSSSAWPGSAPPPQGAS
jgi:hypothetical protein